LTLARLLLAVAPLLFGASAPVRESRAPARRVAVVTVVAIGGRTPIASAARG
jgi:hypothetical protein